MRIESSVTAISWIPSEAIEGLPKLAFELGICKYDAPPPDRLQAGDLERLRAEDRFREANHLKAWIEVDEGRIVAHGHEGGGIVGSTTLRLGVKELIVPGVAFEVLRPEPKVGAGYVRFVQTVGGRAGFPAPRRVRGRPYFRLGSPTAWTTLALTMRSDGSSDHRLEGASPFPRHWIYDHHGVLVEKAGTMEFEQWYREAAQGERTPWGAEDSDAYVTAAESAVERRLSADLMGGKGLTKRRTLEPDETLVRQGELGDELYLLLDGVLVVEIDGEEVAELGPGAIVGELAALERGKRSASLTARTRCRVAVVPVALVDRATREQLAAGRRPS